MMWPCQLLSCQTSNDSRVCVLEMKCRHANYTNVFALPGNFVGVTIDPGGGAGCPVCFKRSTTFHRERIVA